MKRPTGFTGPASSGSSARHTKPSTTSSTPAQPATTVLHRAELAQRQIQRAQLKAIIEARIRVDLNEALAELLIATAPHIAACAGIRASWSRALGALETPYRSDVEEFCRGDGSTNAEA